MNELVLISNNKACTVKSPPVFKMVSNTFYFFEDSIYKTNTENSKKEKIEYQLFQDFQGKYVLYSDSKKHGTVVCPSRELKNIVFPVTMFKDPTFVEFLKANKLDKSKFSYIAQHDQLNILSCVAVSGGIHLYSDANLLFIEHVKTAYQHSAQVFALEYNDQITLVTSGLGVHEKHLETYTFTKEQLGLADKRLTFFDVADRKSLILDFLELVGYKTDEPKQTKEKPSIECSVMAVTVGITPTVIEAVSTQKKDVEVKIYGEIFAEYDYGLDELPSSKTGDMKQKTPIKVMAFKQENNIGIGFVVFNILADGTLQYLDKEVMNKILGGSEYQSDTNGNYVVLNSLYRILKDQGVEDPKNYVGLLSANAVSHPYSEKAFAIGDDRCIYGELKFTLSYGRNKTVKVYEQLEKAVAYLMDSKENTINNFVLANLHPLLNKLSIRGNVDAHYAKQVIEFLIKHGDLN